MAQYARTSMAHYRDAPDSVDLSGRRLISDAGPQDQGGAIWLGDLDEPGKGPAKKFTWLLNPRSSWKTGAHIHPFLSPDGAMAFFNSDESGLLQAYLLRGLPPADGRPRAG